MELVDGHESFLALSNRGALSILDASFKFARAPHWVFGQPWLTVRMERSVAFCLLRSDWSSRWLDVCIGTDASEKGFEFAVRSRCHELASEVGRVRERTRFKRSSRFVRARSRALKTVASEAALKCSSSGEDEVSLSRRESRADFPGNECRLAYLTFLTDWYLWRPFPLIFPFSSPAQCYLVSY